MLTKLLRRQLPPWVQQKEQHSRKPQDREGNIDGKKRSDLESLSQVAFDHQQDARHAQCQKRQHEQNNHDIEKTVPDITPRLPARIVAWNEKREDINCNVLQADCTVDAIRRIVSASTTLHLGLDTEISYLSKTERNTIINQRQQHTH